MGNVLEVAFFIILVVVVGPDRVAGVFLVVAAMMVVVPYTSLLVKRVQLGTIDLLLDAKANA